MIGQAIDPNDERLGSIWILDDIDLDKALERRLQQAREAAEAASRSKDAFLVNMSHELRTPLNAILGFAQILEGDPRLDPGQRRQLDGIQRGGQRLLDLIDEVLDLAKIEAGSLELAPVEWESRAFLRELDGMFRARAERQGLVLLMRSQTDWQVVGEASDGAEAVRLAERLQPQIAVLDVEMPVMNGLEAAHLSERELEVLRLLAEGQRTKEIAATLGISARTVETYRQRLMLKLGIQTLPGLVKFAVRAGLTQSNH